MIRDIYMMGRAGLDRFGDLVLESSASCVGIWSYGLVVSC